MSVFDTRYRTHSSTY